MKTEKWIERNCESLKGKTVAISGSTGVLGGHISSFVAGLGANLILLDRNEKRSNAHAEELKSSIHAVWNMGSTPLDCGYPIDIPCWGCTMVINRALKELALPVDQACAYHDTWCGRIAWYLGKIDFVDESLIRYRVHKNNASCSSTNKYPAVLFRYLKNFSASRKKLGENLIEPTALFVERFAGQLPDFHRKRLAAFGSWRKRMFLTRLYLMIRYRIYAQGVVRTIGLLFL